MGVAAQNELVSWCFDPSQPQRSTTNASEWTGRVELSKEEIPGSKHSMYGYVIYWPTPGFKGRTFKLCVLARWDFNFYVRSFPLRGEEEDGDDEEELLKV